MRSLSSAISFEDDSQGSFLLPFFERFVVYLVFSLDREIQLLIYSEVCIHQRTRSTAGLIGKQDSISKGSRVDLTPGNIKLEVPKPAMTECTQSHLYKEMHTICLLMVLIVKLSRLRTYFGIHKPSIY